MDIQAYIASGVIESYVLGVANEAEVAELQQLQQQHPAIAEAVAACEQWLQANASQHAVPPTPAAKNELWAVLQQDSNEPTTVATGVMTPVRPIRPSGRWMMAAAVILLAGSVALNLYFYSRYTTTQDQYLALLEANKALVADQKVYQTQYQTLQEQWKVLTNPATTKVPMAGVAGKEQQLATVYWHKDTKDVYLVANNLPAAPAGKQYQLWALVDGKPVDAGIIGDCTAFCQLKNIPAAQAFAITLEKAGGSPSPDLTQLQVMGKVPS